MATTGSDSPSPDRRPGTAGRSGVRDRRGRGRRGPMAWPPVPAMPTRAERFDDLVVDAAGRLEERWSAPFPPVELAVEDVPPSDPAPWEHAEVPLGRLFPGTRSLPARLVVYRRPVETRAQGQRELASLVAEVVTEQLAGLLGVRPDELDPELGPDD